MSPTALTQRRCLRSGPARSRSRSCSPRPRPYRSPSPLGLRRLRRNWEWTATTFGPYPGFAPGPYAEYSAPWFGDHRVLRGGAFATRARLLRNTWRNFYRPERRDVLAGFRTCARVP